MEAARQRAAFVCWVYAYGEQLHLRVQLKECENKERSKASAALPDFVGFSTVPYLYTLDK